VIVEALQDDGQGRERLAGAHPGHELVDTGPLVVQDLDAGVDLRPRGEQVRLDGAAPLGGLVGQHLGDLRQGDPGLGQPPYAQQARQVLDAVVAVPRDEWGHGEQAQAVVVAHRPGRGPRQVGHYFHSHGYHRTL